VNMKPQLLHQFILWNSCHQIILPCNL
jgi:hypothetical protein